MTIASNVSRILAETKGAQVIAATKYVEADAIRELYAAGIRDVGENRVQDLLRKQQLLADVPLSWHFLGSLQTNKVKAMINQIAMLHSLDRISLAETIQKHRRETLPCFVEVNVAEERTKAGISPDNLLDFCRNMVKYDKIVIVGLMTMAPLTDDRALLRSVFTRLGALRDSVSGLHLSHAPCTFLSMGMSNDYRIALACGATHLRLGTILYRNGE